MSLRYKMCLFLVVVGAVGLLLLNLVNRHIVLGGIREIEDREAHKNMVRCLNALQQRTAALDYSAHDWASWDDTYEYVVDRNARYEDANLVDASLYNINTNLLMIADRDGQVAAMLAADLDEETRISIPDFSGPVLTERARMLLCGEEDSHVTGVYATELGPMIVAARPIVTSEEEGPVRGTMILGRFIDDQLIEEMAETVALPLSFSALSDGSPPSVDAFVEDEVLIRPVDSGTLRGYALLKDLSGKPVGVISATLSRDIMNHGRSMVALQLLSTLGLAVLMALVVAVLLGWMVLSPLGSLTRQITALARSDDLSCRVTAPAGAEIGDLSAAFNHLLEARENAQSALRETAEQLERSNRDLEEFAFVASHDLQEPLRKIRGFGERIATSHAEALSEEGRDFLDRMLNATNRMARLIGDLLTYARVTAKAQPAAPVELAALAREVLSDLEARIEPLGGRVEIGDLPSVDADPTQMRQLLQNLIGNGLKFHRPDEPPVVQVYGGPPRGRDATGPPLPDGFCQITVADNGIGFDQKYADRIFGAFQRLHGRGEYEGTGIGLAVCRKIVERHGGTIAAFSAPGEGAAFTFSLPMSESMKEAA